jgi:hypothetical protein
VAGVSFEKERVEPALTRVMRKMNEKNGKTCIFDSVRVVGIVENN